jgi:hypothetical protein
LRNREGDERARQGRTPKGAQEPPGRGVRSRPHHRTAENSRICSAFIGRFGSMRRLRIRTCIRSVSSVCDRRRSRRAVEHAGRD